MVAAGLMDGRVGGLKKWKKWTVDSGQCAEVVGLFGGWVVCEEVFTNHLTI
jgi:hypothetical protein